MAAKLRESKAQEGSILASPGIVLSLAYRKRMTRDMQESRRLLDSKTKGALRQVEERSRS